MIPRFLLAKYAPNLNRMEPRNIGVFLWADGKVSAKFLPIEDASFVNDRDTYSRWIESWNAAIRGATVSAANGEAVSKRKASCLDALLSRQEGNYILVDAGELLQEIPKAEVQHATDFLYNDLVAVQGYSGRMPSEQGAQAVVSTAKRMFDSIGLSSRPDWHDGYRIECPVYGVASRLRFSFGLGNGHPLVLYQTANLASEASVMSAALKLRSISDKGIIPQHRCRALVQESDMRSDFADEGLHILQNLCGVVTLDRKGAEDQLLEAAEMAERESI